MALKQHLDDNIRYQQQVDNSQSYVIPFIEQTKTIAVGTKVLEIGCGEGGVLAPFIERGCLCTGVDLDKVRIDLANNFFNKEVEAGQVEFLYKNVYDEDFLEKYRGSFDLIVLKDTIEHIPDQKKFIPYIKQLLNENGQIYFGFPPWYMPFGGHQQVAEKKITMLPYYHILPKPLYKTILKAFGEKSGKIEELMEIYDTRITIERFEKIIENSNLKIINKQHYLLNPIYKYKFGWQPKKQSPIISAIPFIRNFLTTCVYYTVAKS